MAEEEDDSDDGRTFWRGVTGLTKMTGAGSHKELTVVRSKMEGGSIRSTVKLAMTGRLMVTVGGGPRIDSIDEVKGYVLDMLDRSVNKSVRILHDEDGDDDSGFI